MARSPSRVLVLVALAAAMLAVGLVLFGGSSDSTVKAQFRNATGLVKGGRVTVAGRDVGSIEQITLDDSGRALVTMSVDHDVTPIRQGTRAVIRSVGQAGLTNRFVELQPSASGPTLNGDATLPVSQTASPVPIDALLSAFGPKQRDDLDQLIANSAGIYSGSGSTHISDMLGRLSPALREVSAFAGEIAADQGVLSDLLRKGHLTAQAVASRSAQLEDAVQQTATGLGAIATQRRALASSITRLPGVLRSGRRALADTDQTLVSLRPALDEVPPVQRPLVGFMRRLPESLPRAGRVLDDTRAQLPDLNRSLVGLRPLAAPTVNALQALGSASSALLPIARGLRFYGTDVVLGTLAALFGVVSAEYDSTGHYVKANFVQSYQTAFQGPLGDLLQKVSLPDFGIRTGLTRRCPGGNQPPAPDGSSPWLIGEQYCTPGHDLPADVNK